MSRRCPSCDGIIGVDCFNPDECAWISHQQEMQKQHEIETEHMQYQQRLQYLEDKIKSLEDKIQRLTKNTN